MGANDLSAELWRQRELLELLLYKYEVEQVLLSTGKTRWIPYATREIESIVGRLKTAGLSLSMASAQTAAEWGLPEDTHLKGLAESAPEGPWAEILTSHLSALVALTNDVRVARSGSDRLLRAALRSTQETLNLIADTPAIYGANGSTSQPVAHARLVDASL